MRNYLFSLTCCIVFFLSTPAYSGSPQKITDCEFKHCAAAGPFTEIEEVCTYLKQLVSEKSIPNVAEDCTLPSPEELSNSHPPEKMPKVKEEFDSLPIVGIETPFLIQATVLQVTNKIGYESRFFLLMKNHLGWHVLHEIGEHHCTGGNSGCEEYQINTFEIKRWKSQKFPFILVEAVQRSSILLSGGDGFSSRQNVFFLCQLSESPFCYAAIPTLSESTHEIEIPGTDKIRRIQQKGNFHLILHLEDSGKLRITRKSGNVPVYLKPILGTHTLQSFPRSW